MGGGRNKNGAPIYRRRNGVYERLDGKPIKHRKQENQPEAKTERSFRDKINNVSTKEELLEVMKEKYDPQRIDSRFLDNDINMLKRVVNTVDELEERYPFMKGIVTGFSMDNDGMASMEAAFQYDGDVQQTLNLGYGYWKTENDPRLFTGGYRGFHTPNANPEATIAHEFGHAMHNHLIGLLLKNTNGLEKYNLYGKLRKGNILADIEKKAMAAIGIKSVSKARSQISGYAQKAREYGSNPIYESFAEAFADVFSNGDSASAVSKAYVNTLLDEISMYGG